MKEELVLFGTYDEIKEWYDSLGIKSRGSVPISQYVELKPFEKQFEKIKENISKVKVICWFEQEVTQANVSKDKVPHVTITLRTKKVCMIHEGFEE